MDTPDFRDIATASLRISTICLPRISVSDANCIRAAEPRRGSERPLVADKGHSAPLHHKEICIQEVAKSCKSGGPFLYRKN
jgi:hypothetical protein